MKKQNKIECEGINHVHEWMGKCSDCQPTQKPELSICCNAPTVTVGSCDDDTEHFGNPCTCDSREQTVHWECTKCKKACDIKVAGESTQKPKCCLCKCHHELPCADCSGVTQEPNKGDMRVTRASLDCPERTGGECNAVPVEGWETEFYKDLEIEGWIIGANKNSIYHICPKHGVGIDMPLQNKCRDGRLFLSGEDIRQLLSKAKQEARGEALEEMTINLSSLLEFHTHDSIPSLTADLDEGCITCVRNKAICDIEKKVEELKKV